MKALQDVLAVADPATRNVDVKVDGADPIFDTRLRIGEAAAASVAASAAACAAFFERRGGAAQKVTADVPLATASLLGFYLQRLEGGELKRPSAEKATVAIYPTKDDRFIHIHGGFPHLEEGLLKILGCGPDKDEIAAKIAHWEAEQLEEVIAEEGLCGCVIRSREEWEAHPQGVAVGNAPLIEIVKVDDRVPDPEIENRLSAPPSRPLEGVRVLDLTRVLAGPACGRTLASHGASVLNITSEHLPSVEPFVMDTGHGKKSGFLDFRKSDELSKFNTLLQQTDIMCQSYRAGALDKFGLSMNELIERRPGLIFVSINCYGHEGPWASRPGWEQLAQSATGIAHHEACDGIPKLLPAAATDYTTGYLAAYGAALALLRRQEEGGSYHVRVSLCRTGMWLMDLGNVPEDRFPDLPEIMSQVDVRMLSTKTPLGVLRHLPPAVELSKTPARWELPPVPLGTHPAAW